MADITHRVMTLRELIGEYFGLEEGHLIGKPTELLRVADIKDGRHADHPHKGRRAYISRKAVKHFVEERKRQLSLYHTPVQVLEKITFAAEQISEVIINFDKYELKLTLQNTSIQSTTLENHQFVFFVSSLKIA